MRHCKNNVLVFFLTTSIIVSSLLLGCILVSTSKLLKSLLNELFVIDRMSTSSGSRQELTP